MVNLPQRLFLEITKKCNLKCQLCKLWKNKDPSNKLSFTERRKVIIIYDQS